MVKNDINLNSSQKSVEYFADYHGEGDPVFESIINYYLLYKELSLKAKNYKAIN